jgi:TATA-box binding protein (TBP) (component of TFIID and TFIIIB)
MIKVTDEQIEKAKATFPKYTVYLCYRGGKTTVTTSDHYAQYGKTYQECTEAMNKTPQDFKERQDEDLYNIAKEIERKKESTIDLEEFIERLRNISSDIDELLLDLEE